MPLSFHLEGVNEFVAAIDSYETRIFAAQGQAVRDGLHLIERRTKQNLSTGSHRKGEPTTSAPGTPPDLVSGSLRRSVRVSRVAATGRRWSGQVGPTMVYSRIQELGGDTGRSTLPARPYLQPAFEEVVRSGELHQAVHTVLARVRP